jgi:small subunit ribosomal protein S16
MPTKIRLQRKGKKGQPFYHLVVADGRAPRDGKFIERLGTYNPMTHPATIELNFDRALYWVQVGAQPTDTARSILSNQGVLLKYHLIKGIEKGALTGEQVEEKFADWKKGKAEKLANKSKEQELSEKEKAKKSLEEERKINEAKAAELAKKRAKASLKDAGAVEPGSVEAEAEPTAEAAAGPVQDETAETLENKEEPAAEVKEGPAAEAPKSEAAEEVKEEPAAEAKEEPAAEAPKSEAAEEGKEEDKEEETGKKAE